MNISSLEMTAPPPADYRALVWAVLLSLGLHAFVILGVRFVVPEPVRFKNTVMLDVVLMNSKTEQAPKQAKVLAQTNLDGGGNTDERKQRAKTPLPPKPDILPSQKLDLAQAKQQQLEQEADHLFKEIQVKSQKNEVLLHENQRRQNSKQAFDRESLLNQAREIARLEGEIAQQYHAYQTRPRRAFFGGRAKEARFARYVEEWRMKIERIGNLNYPQAAREQAIHGKLILSVEIHADGRLGKLSIDRSSGHAVLDEAAKKIVQMGAPYARFPDDLAKNYDILTIVRTWSFTKENALYTAQ